MSKKEIKIIHWDDDKSIAAFVEGTVRTILAEYDCTVNNDHFYDNPDDFLVRAKAGKFDLIILDIEDKNEDIDTGFRLLNEIITVHKNSIPVLIFSRHGRVLEKMGDFKKEHNLVIDFLNKSLRGEPNYHKTVGEKLKLLLNLTNNKIKIIPFEDHKTKAAVKIIGLHNLQPIISEFISQKSFIKEKEVVVKAVTPGYSGAFVLELKFGSVSKLIKISQNREAVLKEYENLNTYSHYLPSSIKLDYEKTSPEIFSSNGWHSIIYEFIEYSTTLFGYFQSNPGKDNIERVLADIFSKEKLLKLHAITDEINKPANENILEDIDSGRAAFIHGSVNNLRPLLQNFVTLFDESIISSITENHNYQEISASKIGHPKSVRILSHADLHADNILCDAQGNPIIIDPGSINYKHWAYDVNRLLADLFIRGIGYGTTEFYNIGAIDKDYQMAALIIKRTGIDNPDNNPFITAINWLTQHISNLYPSFFTAWEYQLGLALEFLKSSYKSIFIPPNKRVVALLAACEAIKQANSSIRSL
jgi:CheY-like chemotaxis protein